jgi:hypothetical protein
LLAHIADPVETTDRRRMKRRTLRLDVAARSETTESAVVIRDLSRTGLLLETDAAFAVGETFILVLPELGAAPARIVRNKGNSFGCEFLSPVPASAISAALLKAPYDPETGELIDDAVDDYRGEYIAKRPSSTILFTAVTALFTAMLLLILVALASLSFSGN